MQLDTEAHICMPSIQETVREDLEFEASLDYRETLSQKKGKKKRN